MEQELKNKINKAQIVSFDVFDTLIYRMVDRPEAVFEMLGSFAEVESFSIYRKQAQINASSRLYQKFKYPHANFDEIYEELGKNLVCRKNIIDIKNKEIELEFKLLYPNIKMKEVYEYVKSLGKKIIITTDMYFDSSVIEKMLISNGYTGFSKIYDSANERKAKFDTSLYEYIIRDQDVEPSSILHIGDNKKDDIDNAKSLGLDTFYYVSDRNIEKSREGDYITSINNGLEYIEPKMKLSFFEDFGYKIGGAVYYSLIKFLKTNKLENSNVFYLSRDGYNLFNILKEENSKYIYTSRRALLLASITKIDDSSIKDLPPFSLGQKTSDILDYLCISDSITDDDIKKLGFENKEKIINTEKEKEIFKKLYFNKKEVILKRCKYERDNAIKYFSENGLFENNITVFDSGWHGSSQKLLEDFLKIIGFKHEVRFCYAGIFDDKKSREQLEGRDYRTCFFDISDSNDVINTIKDSVVIFELLFGASKSSMWYYGKDKIVFEDDTFEDVIKNEILSGIKYYYELRKNIWDKLDIPLDNYYTLMPLYNLIINPSMEEAKQIGNIENVDGFVKKEYTKEYIAYVDEEMLSKNPNIELYWEQGFNKRDDISNNIKNFIDNREKIYKRKFNNKILRIINKFIIFIKEHGFRVLFYRINNEILNYNKKEIDEYSTWIRNNDKKYIYKKFSYNPLISVVIPVYNVRDNELIECIESVLSQTYTNFELILVDDNSTKYNVIDILKKYEKNSKIKVLYHSINEHISQTTNDGIMISTGEFIAFMDCDDILDKNALYEVVNVLNKNKDIDFIYTDEDKIDESGANNHSVFFKPNWSKDSFLSIMYTSHLGVYRKSIIDEISGLKVGLEGSQDYDMTLRFIEKTNKIYHIPKVLYHWRIRSESVASDPEAKPYALDAVLNLKKEYLTRNNINGEVEYVPNVYQHRIVYDFNDNISIIISTKNSPLNLERLILSIIEKNNNINYEIIVVDTGSKDERVREYNKLKVKYNFTYLYKENISKFEAYNIGEKMAKWEMLLFIEDGCEILTNDFIKRLAGNAKREKIGAVGCKILHNNSTKIYSDGIVNLSTGPNRLLQGANDYNLYYYCSNNLDFNYLAVSGECFMITREIYNNLKGFDSKLEYYNDADFCMRLFEKGYRNLIRNDCVIYYKGLTEMPIEDSIFSRIKARNILNSKHPKLIGHDPYYSENLNQESSSFLIDTNKQYKKTSRPYLCDKKISEDKIDNNIIYSISRLVSEDEVIKIEGFAFDNRYKNNNSNRINIILKSEKKVYSFKTKKHLNYTYSKLLKKNLDMCYFKVNIKKTDIIKENYNIFIEFKNSFNKTKHFINTNINIENN